VVDRGGRSGAALWGGGAGPRGVSAGTLVDGGKMKVMFFPDGCTAAFKNGTQVPEYQKSWTLLYVKMLVDAGVDPTTVEFTMPDARRARVFVCYDGSYNWEMVE